MCRKKQVKIREFEVRFISLCTKGEDMDYSTKVSISAPCNHLTNFASFTVTRLGKRESWTSSTTTLKRATAWTRLKTLLMTRATARCT